ncbi:MAG: MBL fold metallo-hydrolase [Prevotellaceae bacterium]|jgi:phosphoribosyl 1,2-cyclic phosphate phosphodiesterase|nr:MBL fold metallo-hydrolase [Prevotellaceae bacterium]
MMLTFLGTGTSQGVPMIACPCGVCASTDPHDKRLRTSALVTVGGKNILLDAGPDFRQQLLREKVTHLEGVLLTHEHKDHMGGLDDVRALNYFMKKSIDVYGEQRVLKQLKEEYAYAFGAHRYPGVPDMTLHAISDDKFLVQDVEVVPVRALHYKLPVYGFRIGKLVYLTDASFVDEKSVDLMKGCEVLVVNALRQDKHLSHFTLGEALQLIEQVKPRRAYLTHASHQLGLHKEVSKILPKNVWLAYDGLRVEM